jgi:hypothetical protein
VSILIQEAAGHDVWQEIGLRHLSGRRIALPDPASGPSLVRLSDLRTKSAFLKNYSPDTVVQQFQCKNEGAEETKTFSEGAGRKFVSNQGVFEPLFVIKSKDWMPLMLAVYHELSSQLLQQGAEILSQTGAARDGYRVQYQTGRNIGEITVEPLRLITVASLSGPRAALPDDEQAVELRITIQEKWFKSKPGLMTIKVSPLAN